MTGRFEHLDARPGGSHRLVLAPRGGVAVRDSGSMDSAAIAAELAPIRHRATLARRRAARASPATTQTHRHPAQRPAGRTPTPRIRSGPSTSSLTPPPTDDRSRVCPSSTKTPANASAAWLNARSPPTGSSTYWTASPPCADTPQCWAAAAAPNWPARRWPTGPASASESRSSRPANLAQWLR